MVRDHRHGAGDVDGGVPEVVGAFSVGDEETNGTGRAFITVL